MDSRLAPGSEPRDVLRFSPARICRQGAGIFAAAGCLAGDRNWRSFQAWGYWPLLIGGGVLLLGAAVRSGTRVGKATPMIASAVVLLTAFGFCAGRAASARSGVERGVVAELAGTNVWVVARGRVASQVQRDGGQNKFDLRLSEVTIAQRATQVNEHLSVVVPASIVSASGADSKVDAGLELVVEGYVAAPSPEMRERAVRSRSLGTLKARGMYVTGAAPRWLAATTAVRRFMRSGAEPVLGPEYSGLLLGLMYGDTSGMTFETSTGFRRAGLSHLTAVSGQNFALVMGVVAGALRLVPQMWSRRRLRNAILIAVAAAFIALTRWEPSVLRAGAMAVVMLLAHSSGVKLRFTELVSLAALAVLASDPMLLFSVGFQLSVAATLAIACWAHPISAYLNERCRIPKFVALPVAVAFTAELGVGPLIASHFGTIQLLSVPANLLAVPAAGVASVWGYFACSIAAVMPALGNLAHIGTSLPLRWVNAVASVVREVPIAEIQSGRVPWTVTAVIYASFMTAMLLFRRRFEAGRKRARGEELLANRGLARPDRGLARPDRAPASRMPGGDKA